MKTYSKITDAFDEIIGRARSRDEVEKGATVKVVNGLPVREAEYCKYYNKEGNKNTFNEDFTIWTRTINKAKKHSNPEVLINSYELQEPFDVLIGGEFQTEQTVVKEVRTRVGPGRYTIKTMPVTEMVTHRVQHLGQFVVDSYTETDKEITFISKKVEK